MSEREPLTGWEDGEVNVGALRLTAAPFPGHSVTWWEVSPDPELGRRGSSGSPRIAAEDAARALVREMANALGLAIQADPCLWTWNDCYYWDTACGTTADYSDPRRPDVSFCHGCGGRILAGEGVSDG